MDKRYTKQYRLTGHKNDRIGMPLGIHDMNGVELCSGDTIRYDDDICIILWNADYNKYFAMRESSRWYGDEKYNIDCYGKCYTIPMDDGARMRIEKITRD